jgi:hypothetical protein
MAVEGKARQVEAAAAAELNLLSINLLPYPLSALDPTE